ncbi:hypothetical protein B0H12DRAFT_1230153 [Mycena haematopus]|nr:hypothetical protein B0H12DRAFT_1230153 [Mycena haematopus]
MPAQELRARIMEIDNLIKKLERDKSLLQRQLNTVLDPIASLPLEICSEIFLQSLSPFHEPTADRAPTLLLNICNTWSAIALSTPDLWSAIEIYFPCNQGLTQLLPIWFQRARNRPLSVSFRGDLSKWDSTVSAVIWRQAARLKRLEISDDDQYDGRGIDVFRSTIPRPLPLLEHLTIRFYIERRGFADQIFELLRLAPNLVECVFNCVPLHGSVTGENPVLPSLRRLTFGDWEYDRDGFDDVILKFLSLPALEALSLPMYSVSAGDLLSFMKRSTPPLQELVMGYQHHPTPNSIELHECFHLIPSLARFEMWRPDTQSVEHLSAALADSPSLLPNLRSLTIHTASYIRISSSAWRTLVRAVSTRRIQFHLVGHPSRAPPADVLDAFRELVGDGVEISITGKSP